ncbi:hypothetical protein [Dactylosporangium sp. CA-233914]|uniref:hypothetical protein n=1 Tax=Dactylosporangium sp. CA-233914 TaxID=3239934 RepID=UPI003D8A813F
MTKKRDENDRRSLVDEVDSTRKGAQGMAAARLAIQIVRLLVTAKSQSRLTNRDLADELDVTEGRVSQVLNGDGNIHIGTLARFMHAMGYALEIVAMPLRSDREPIYGAAKRLRRRRDGGAASSGLSETARSEHVELFEQRFLTPHGVVDYSMYVPSDSALGCAPTGGPVAKGKVRISSLSTGHTGSVRVGKTGWKAKEPEPGPVTTAA